MTNDMQIKEFLTTPDILDRIVRDMDTLGCVGERENKILGYLLAISRKLDEPLSGIVVSSSGIGKSKLVDTLQKLTPAEDVVFTSRLTPQSLYYMPKDFLRHKLLIVEERTGSQLADYAIRTLQSKGKLSLATTIKNHTIFVEVEGPVSVLETTTFRHINPENMSRCFILHLDESPEQTERIHKYQRLMKTETGMDLKSEAHKIIEFHQHVQRLIEPAIIVIPYAEKLSFPLTGTSARRDQQKFLTLIEAITLLFQYQRKHIKQNNRIFIESTIQDYEVAFELFRKSHKDSFLFAHSKASLLLREITKLDKTVFSRNDIAEYCDWPDYRVRDNIKHLEEAGVLEIVEKSKGKETLYRLNCHINLAQPEELKK